MHVEGVVELINFADPELPPDEFTIIKETKNCFCDIAD